ncbi:MAG: transposase domain-containing protein [Rhodospirillales bacterium]
METAKLNGVDHQGWLADVLDRIVGYFKRLFWGQNRSEISALKVVDFGPEWVF